MVKLFSKAKYVVTGIIIGSLLSGSIAIAANNQYLLSLFEAKMVFNGVEKQGSDKKFQYYNGTTYVPVSLIYNGTTYVPLRYFSESIGQPVKYEGTTKTIYVGQVPEDNKIWKTMSDTLQPYYKNNYIRYFTAPEIKMGEKKYFNGYQIQCNYSPDNEPGIMSFNLEGNYKTIKGLIGLDDSDNRYDEKIEFYVDGNLKKTYVLEAGSMPQDFEIDVTGALKLDIYSRDTERFNISKIDLADVMIK